MPLTFTTFFRCQMLVNNLVKLRTKKSACLWFHFFSFFVLFLPNHNFMFSIFYILSFFRLFISFVPFSLYLSINPCVRQSVFFVCLSVRLSICFIVSFNPSVGHFFRMEGVFQVHGQSPFAFLSEVKKWREKQNVIST